MSSHNSDEFSDKNLTIQAAVSLACADLGISETDLAERARVVALIEPLAQSSPMSISTLKTFACHSFACRSDRRECKKVGPTAAVSM